jgi:SAM-dependent methyltransferase
MITGEGTREDDEDELPLEDDDLLEHAEPPPPDDETTAHRALAAEPHHDDAPTGRLAERLARVAPTRRKSEGASSPQAAELYDAVVVPEWITLFAAPLLALVPAGFRGQILDASAGTGHLSLELLRRVDAAARVVAIEPDTALLDLLRRRTTGAAGRQIFARAETPSALSFGDEVFDLVVAAACPAIADKQVAGELRRVMAPGARLLVSTPLRGTFEEVLDMMAEVGARRGGELVSRVAELRARTPDAASLATSLRRLGLQPVEVKVLERRVVFRSVREIFAHPIIAHVALADWRAAAGFESGGEEVLAEVEQAFATYVPRGPVPLTVQLGIVEAGRG